MVIVFDSIIFMCCCPDADVEPISHDIAILSLRFPIRAIPSQGDSHSLKMVRYPPLTLSLTLCRDLNNRR